MTQSLTVLLSLKLDKLRDFDHFFMQELERTYDDLYEALRTSYATLKE